MKNIKTFSVLVSEGYFYEGEFSGTMCFVPVSAIQAGRLNEALYGYRRKEENALEAYCLPKKRISEDTLATMSLDGQQNPGKP
jgi:hypothetical protein